MKLKFAHNKGGFGFAIIGKNHWFLISITKPAYKKRVPTCPWLHISWK